MRAGLCQERDLQIQFLGLKIRGGREGRSPVPPDLTWRRHPPDTKPEQPVRSGALPPESIQKAVSEFRVQHATNLGIKDVASLDHLVQGTPLPVCFNVANVIPIRFE